MAPSRSPWSLASRRSLWLSSRTLGFPHRRPSCDCGSSLLPLHRGLSSWSGSRCSPSGLSSSHHISSVAITSIYSSMGLSACSHSLRPPLSPSLCHLLVLLLSRLIHTTARGRTFWEGAYCHRYSAVFILVSFSWAFICISLVSCFFCSSFPPLSVVMVIDLRSTAVCIHFIIIVYLSPSVFSFFARYCLCHCSV